MEENAEIRPRSVANNRGQDSERKPNFRNNFVSPIVFALNLNTLQKNLLSNMRLNYFQSVRKSEDFLSEFR